MSNNFKLSAIVVALATVSGTAIAAPTIIGTQPLPVGTSLGDGPTKIDFNNPADSYDKAIATTETVAGVQTVILADGTEVKLSNTLATAVNNGTIRAGDAAKGEDPAKFYQDVNFAANTRGTVNATTTSNDTTLATNQLIGTFKRSFATKAVTSEIKRTGTGAVEVTSATDATKIDGTVRRYDDSALTYTELDLNTHIGASKNEVIINETNVITGNVATNEAHKTVNNLNIKTTNRTGARNADGSMLANGIGFDNTFNSDTVINHTNSEIQAAGGVKDSTTLSNQYADQYTNFYYKRNAAGDYVDVNNNVITPAELETKGVVVAYEQGADGKPVSALQNVNNVLGNINSPVGATANRLDVDQVLNDTVDDYLSNHVSAPISAPTIYTAYQSVVNRRNEAGKQATINYQNGKTIIENNGTFDNVSTAIDGKVVAKAKGASDSKIINFEADNVLAQDQQLSSNTTLAYQEHELKDGTPTLKATYEENHTVVDNEVIFNAAHKDVTDKKGSVNPLGSTLAANNGPLLVQSSNNTETHNVKRTDADGFEAWVNTTSTDTSKYNGNLGTTVEVSRELVDNKSLDARDRTTEAYIVTSGTVAGIDPSSVPVRYSAGATGTAGGQGYAVENKSQPVRFWTETKDGKEIKHYYVVAGHDLDGKEIRLNVNYNDATAGSVGALEKVVDLDVVNNKAEKVNNSTDEVFYTLNEVDKSTIATTLKGKDGKNFEGFNSKDVTTDTTLYTVGRNELDRQYQQTTKTAGKNATSYTINSKGVIEVDSIDNTSREESVLDKQYQAGQAKVRETANTKKWSNNTTDAAGNVTASDVGHDNNTTVNYAGGKTAGELDNTFVRDAASTQTAKAAEQNAGDFGYVAGMDVGAFNYDGTAKANIGSNSLRSNGTVDGSLEVSDAKAGTVVVDSKTDTANTVDTKVYQDGGVKAYEQTAANSINRTVTYADGTTGVNNWSNSNEVTLFNKGKDTKYRAATNTWTDERTGKNYQADEDGDVILVNGKPVEIGTVSQKASTNTAENLYQIGQERFKDSVTTTNAANSMTNLDGSSASTTTDRTDTKIEYRAGQKDGKSGENTIVAKTVSKSTSKDGIVADRTENTNNAAVGFAKGEFVEKTTDAYDDARKVTLANGTVADNYSYAETTTTNDYRNGEARRTLLADHELDSVITTKRAESRTTVDAEGKTIARSIERNNTTTVRSDESAKTENVGKSVDTVAGVTAQIDDSQIDTVNKFGNYEATVRSNTVTTTQEDGSSTSTNKTRTDSVNGVELTAKQVVTDKAGKATTVEKGTSVTAGTVATDRVQAPQIVLADRNQQVDANGSIVKEQIKATAATANRLTGQYKVGNDTVYSLRVFKDGKEVTEYFTKNANGQFQAFTGDVKSIEDGSNAPVAGGTTANTDSIETVGKVTNVITDKNVSYGEEVATRGVTTVKGSLNNGEQLEAVVGTTETTVTKQSVTTGIIGQTQDGANVYGVDVVKDNQKTTVTASGVETTGTVKAATVEATTVNASTINAGKVILANNGTVAEGSKEAVSGGQLHTLQTNVTKEITEFKGNVNNTINEFKADVNSRVNSLNSRVDDVQKTAYRGIAIALAAQQAVPNIAPGQVAVFGGVGHYEGETAGSIGVVTSFTDRISASGALGFASGSEFGGRVGVSYVFGGK